MTEEITKEQIRFIHTLVNKFNMEDEEYREFLYKHFKVLSCKDLNTDQASDLIHKLNLEFDISYKQGFYRGLNLAMANKTNLQQFEYLVKVFENRDLTDIEIKMFNFLDDIQQETMIVAYKNRL